MQEERPSAFISYASADKEMARRLAHDLQSAGIDVWFDEFKLRAGDPIVHTIIHALEVSEFLLVLVSKNSLESKWVLQEVRVAFERLSDAGAPSIIPIRIDSSEPPEFLQSTQKVDLRSDYDLGLRQLLSILRIERPQERVTSIIDAGGLADELAKDRKELRSPGFWVTTVLGILTLLATLLTAWPALFQAFGERSHVYYSVERTGLAIPESLEAERIREILQNEGIPDSSIKIEIVNRGTRVAREIKVGLRVDGHFSPSSFGSKPDATSDPVWVTITLPSIQEGDSSTTLLLNDLVPDRGLDVSYAYHSLTDAFQCDVVSDGVLATQVASVSSVPEWSLWHEIRWPIGIFAFGLLLSIVIGFIVASLSSKTFRDLAVELVHVVSPIGASALRTFIRLLD